MLTIGYIQVNSSQIEKKVSNVISFSAGSTQVYFRGFSWTEKTQTLIRISINSENPIPN